MAILPAGVTTLGRLRADVRSRTHTESIQESQFLDTQLDSIIHQAVQSTRTQMQLTGDPLISEFYKTTIEKAWTGTPQNLIGIDITGLNIFDMKSVKVMDSTLGVVPIRKPETYDRILNLYRIATLNAQNAVMAKIVSDSDSGVLTIAAFISSNLTPGVPTVTYTRNPVKAVVAATVIDLPEKWMPQATQLAVQIAQQKLGQFRKAA